MSDPKTLTLTLPYPPTANTYYRYVNGRPMISSKGRQYRRDVAWLCTGWHKLSGELRVRVDMYPPDRRKRDVDNIQKPLLDSLEKAGVYENDNQVSDLRTVRSKEVVKGGQVIVTITELPDAA